MKETLINTLNNLERGYEINMINELNVETNTIKEEKENMVNNNLEENILMEDINNEIKENIKKEIILGEEQQKIYNIMENTYDNMLILGKAGTGKSELLKYYKEHTIKSVLVVSPTGIAALNVGGRTIHSTFHFDFGLQYTDKILGEWFTHYDGIFDEIDTIIFDEISMIRADLFEAINIILQNGRKCILPFGGIQVIGFGDLYQLPPVAKGEETMRYLQDTYRGIMFYDSPAFQEGEFKIYELGHIYRQSDFHFKNLLNRVRKGEKSKDLLDELNKRVVIPDINDNIITITSTKPIADGINKRKLDELKGKEYTYTGILEGNIKENDLPTDVLLRLKEGSQIIMVVNDKKGRWVNGTAGTISSLSDNSITVKIRGIDYKIERHTWDKLKPYYDEKTKKVEEHVDGTFKQFPVKLAWATTIHRSQSKTYDSLLIDLGSGAFEDGQLYVALSRCTSLDKLYLKKPIRPTDIKVNKSVVNFMKVHKIIKLYEEENNLA